jgi:hypothetical protein
MTLTLKPVEQKKTYESVRKQLDIIEKSVKSKRLRGILKVENKYTYVIYKWTYGGTTYFSYCADTDWEKHPGRKSGIVYHDTVVI